jgi:hypothetical protein
MTVVIHYHIEIAGPTIKPYSVAMYGHENLLWKVKLATKKVRELTNSEVSSIIKGQTKFEDGSSINWHVCENSKCEVLPHAQILVLPINQSMI